MYTAPSIASRRADTRSRTRTSTRGVPSWPSPRTLLGRNGGMLSDSCTLTHTPVAHGSAGRDNVVVVRDVVVVKVVEVTVVEIGEGMLVEVVVDRTKQSG